MSGQGMAKRLRVYAQAPVVCLIVTFVCLPCRDVAAQVRQSYAGEVSATDAYGNAVPRYPYRRRAGTFGDEPEQGRLRRVQVESGGVARRGVLSALARPNDMFRMMQARRSQYPYPAGSVSPVIRGTYARYGGFARRAPSGQPGDMRAVFQRRQALIRATALNAPVRTWGCPQRSLGWAPRTRNRLSC